MRKSILLSILFLALVQLKAEEIATKNNGPGYLGKHMVLNTYKNFSFNSLYPNHRGNMSFVNTLFAFNKTYGAELSLVQNRIHSLGIFAEYGKSMLNTRRSFDYGIIDPYDPGTFLKSSSARLGEVQTTHFSFGINKKYFYNGISPVGKYLSYGVIFNGSFVNKDSVINAISTYETSSNTNNLFINDNGLVVDTAGMKLSTSVHFAIGKKSLLFGSLFFNIEAGTRLNLTYVLRELGGPSAMNMITFLTSQRLMTRDAFYMRVGIGLPL